MENLNYNHLYYFWVIAKEGGVTPACKKLSLSQPTLSAQLKNFEQNIGKVLFERKARKLILNDEGKLVFDYADLIFKKGREMVDALQGSAVENISVINVGVVAHLPRKNIYNYLKIPLNNRRHNLNLITQEFIELLNKLSSHQIDMLIAHRPAPSEFKHLKSHVLEKIPMVFVATRDYKNLRRKFPQSLMGQNIYLPTYDPDLRAQLDMYFKKHQVEVRLKGEIEDSELLRVIAVSGQGVVCVARTAISDLIKSKELSVIGDQIDVWQNFYLITAERSEQQPVVERMIKRLLN